MVQALCPDENRIRRFRNYDENKIVTDRESTLTSLASRMFCTDDVIDLSRHWNRNRSHGCSGGRRDCDFSRFQDFARKNDDDKRSGRLLVCTSSTRAGLLAEILCYWI